MRAARSSAAQHMIFEYTKCRCRPLTSHTPRSRRRQLKITVSANLVTSAHARRDLSLQLEEGVDSENHLAENVELKVARRAVADSHRTGAGTAFEMIERAFP